MVFSNHSALLRRPDNSVILRQVPSNRDFHYTISQMREFARFDADLRNGLITGPGRIIPGGYLEWTAIWAQDTSTPFGFASYDPETGVISIGGPHLSADELAPLPVVPAPPPAMNPRRQAIMDDLMWAQLERNMRNREAYRERDDKRRRNEEGEAHQGGDKRMATGGGRVAKKVRDEIVAVAEAGPSRVLKPGFGKSKPSKSKGKGKVTKLKEPEQEKETTETRDDGDSRMTDAYGLVDVVEKESSTEAPQ